MKCKDKQYLAFLLFFGFRLLFMADTEMPVLFSGMSSIFTI